MQTTMMMRSSLSLKCVARHQRYQPQQLNNSAAVVAAASASTTTRRVQCAAAVVGNPTTREQQDVSAVPTQQQQPSSASGSKYSPQSAAAATAGEQSGLPADIKRVLFSKQQIADKVAEMAAQICRDYKGKPLAIIGVLNGAFVFTSGECFTGWRCCEVAALALLGCWHPHAYTHCD